MLKVESFNVISVTAQAGWKIGEADASRDVSVQVLAIPSAPFRLSGPLAQPVGPSQPATARPIHIDTPLPATHAGHPCLQSRLKRPGLCFRQINTYFHSSRTVAALPGAAVLPFPLPPKRGRGCPSGQERGPLRAWRSGSRHSGLELAPQALEPTHHRARAHEDALAHRHGPELPRRTAP